MEETSAELARKLHEVQAAVGKSRTRQEALDLQSSLRALEADRTRAAEDRAALEDCKGALERLGTEAQRSTAALEGARAEVKELQESLRSKESALAAVRGAAAPGDNSGCGLIPPPRSLSLHVKLWLLSTNS